MPIVDKPLSQLKTYTGITPCPDDFDEYWDARLKRLRALKPEYSLNEVDVKCRGAIIQRLDFIAEDGSHIHCRIARPDTTEKVPVLFCFHGLSGNCGDYVSRLKWAMAGFAEVCMDCRGQAGLSGDNSARHGMNLRGAIMRGFDDGPDGMYFTSIFSDIVQLVEIVKTLPFADTDRMFAHGGSQGGALTVACAALCCDDIKGLTPVYPYLSDYKRVYEMDLLNGAYEDIKYYLRSYLPEDGEREEFWKRLGYIDIQNLAKRINGKTLWYCGLMDTTCPPSTQFACYNKITAPKEIFVASNYGHEGGHRDWHDKEFMFITSLANELKK